MLPAQRPASPEIAESPSVTTVGVPTPGPSASAGGASPSTTPQTTSIARTADRMTFSPPVGCAAILCRRCWRLSTGGRHHLADRERDAGRVGDHGRAPDRRRRTAAARWCRRRAPSARPRRRRRRPRSRRSSARPASARRHHGDDLARDRLLGLAADVAGQAEHRRPGRRTRSSSRTPRRRTRRRRSGSGVSSWLIDQAPGSLTSCAPWRVRGSQALNTAPVGIVDDEQRGRCRTRAGRRSRGRPRARRARPRRRRSRR